VSDGYAADTVMRLPGYFRLRARALQDVLIAKAPERRIIDELESRESALGAVAAHHPRLRWSATTDLVHLDWPSHQQPEGTGGHRE
jgi:hypothetical protein